MSALEVAACVAAILLGTVVKAITGMGFPLIAIPVISLFVSVEDAVCVVALPNVVMNAALSWRMRGASPHTRDLPVLGVTAIVGAVLGTWLLVNLPEQLLMGGLSLVVLAYVGNRMVRPERFLAPATTRCWSPVVGLGVGVLQGAVGIPGPLLAAWIHAYGLIPNAFVLSISLLFLLSGGAQLAVLVDNGMVSGPRLWIALAAIPLVLGVIPVGERLRDRLDRNRFDRFVLAVLLLSAASLAVRAVR
jgi:uncharacterized membrane protein YfcA